MNTPLQFTGSGWTSRSPCPRGRINRKMSIQVSPARADFRVREVILLILTLFLFLAIENQTLGGALRSYHYNCDPHSHEVENDSWIVGYTRTVFLEHAHTQVCAARNGGLLSTIQRASMSRARTGNAAAPRLTHSTVPPSQHPTISSLTISLFFRIPPPPQVFSVHATELLLTAAARHRPIPNILYGFWRERGESTLNPKRSGALLVEPARTLARLPSSGRNSSRMLVRRRVRIVSPQVPGLGDGTVANHAESQNR